MCIRDSYKAEKKGKKLVMNLGYSHPVELEDPEGITTEAPDATTVIVKGIDKAKVGNYAANIRAWRAPEPYTVSYTHLNDHPHGGGEGKASIGRVSPVTPWGKPALGYKTRKKKKESNKYIVKDRRVK